MNEAEYLMKNIMEIEEGVIRADNTLRDLHNCSYDMKAESITVFLFIQNNS